MFHLQLRQFPHNHCQFNLTDQELRSVAEIWASGEWLAMGERRWNSHQAKLTIIEAPRIAVQQLSMGRGWRHVERHGEDVTRRVLDAASASFASAAATPVAGTAHPAPVAGPSGTPYAPATGGAPGARESPPSAARSLLGDGPRAEALLAAWQDTARRFPERSPSECLALAEQELDSQSGRSDEASPR
jgi:hypothetical protein